MGTHPIFESDFDCLTENDRGRLLEYSWLDWRRARSLGTCRRRLEGNLLRGPSARRSRSQQLLNVGSKRVDQCEEIGQDAIELRLSQLALYDRWRCQLEPINGHSQVHLSQTQGRHRAD